MNKGGDVIDTCVLILAMKHTQGGEERSSSTLRAYEYLAALEAEQVAAIVPSVVVAELLTPMEPAAAAQVWTYLQSNFIVAPFDGRAAVLAAGAMRAALAARRAVANPGGPSRHEAKVDGMIVGTALASGATRIVSFNVDDFKVAGSGVVITEPPPVSQNRPLPFNLPPN
ncbi:MAG: hypothetical protein H3C53_06600 [Trueperaceae bacterium]|nr:hypothetical protein [Trueperaceae bacterium]